MARESSHQTFYTRQVQRLISRIYIRSPLKDTILDHALGYFEQQENKVHNEVLRPAHERSIECERALRHSHLLAICLEIIALAEGDDFAESNRKSAQFLGTIQLLSPTQGSKVKTNNELCKCLYKVILSLRLLDRLIIDGKVEEHNILKYVDGVTARDFKKFSAYNAEKAQRFIDQIKIPLVMAGLLQEIGQYHPSAQSILNGPDGTDDASRTLNADERRSLLQIKYRESINYIVEGVGIPGFVGNTKAERDSFYEDENEKLNFIKQLLKSSINPKKTIGNALKIPQIYASIILSTKLSYNYKLLPKVYQVLNKNAQLNICSQDAVDALYKITGIFPQGFGIVYMPFSELGDKGDCYEYAIVNGLYPKKSEEPICRVATRKLAYIGHGHDLIITKSMNLYFTQTAKKLATLSKERLHEILELLSSNANERKQLDLLPRCWHAKDYFSIKSNQKVWNKTD
jgi:hypothetical protein